MHSFQFEDQQTLGRLLRYRASTSGPSTALLVESEDGTIRSFSYSELLDRAERASAVLRAHGVKRSDKIHIHLGNRIEFIDCWLACALIGAVIVPTGLTSVAAEVAYVVEHSQSVLTIVDERHVDSVVSRPGGGALPTHRVPILTVSHQHDWLTGATESDRAPHADAPVQARDPLAVMYTSGTMSRPKGVVVTHANYVHVGEVTSQQLRIGPEDRWLVVLPLFHANAQYYSFMSALSSGASVALMSKFSATRWPDQVREHNVTLASLFAAPIRMILSKLPDDASPSVLKNLRVTLFAQNLTALESQRFETAFGASLLQLYGMTETISPPLMNPTFGARRHDSIGRPIVNTKVRVWSEDGNDAPGYPREGELLVQGEPGVSLMLEYHDDPTATTATLEGGWLRTGDRVRVDNDGYFYFVDRLKDMVKRSGENVALSEIERVINELPGVKESAAIGLPDETHDVRIKAFVVVEDGHQMTADDVRDWCRQHLARFKVPDDVSFLATLPRTAVGKIEKRSLNGTSS